MNSSIHFFITLSKTATILSNRFDKGLGGIGFNEFLILYHLSLAEEQKLRRVDIAEKIGVTASGVTRLLLPMEKIGLIHSGPVGEDARVREVHIAPGGKIKLEEALERLEIFAEDIIPQEKISDIENCSKTLMDIGGRTLML